MADVFNIAGRIHSTSQEEVVTTTNEILDATQEKKQSEVNQEVSEELALHTNRLNALTGQNYVTVVATQSTTAADIPTLINASGEGEQADTLYRVGFWDGSAHVADKYTEYAWNGTAYVILDVKSSIGEVFDISLYKAVGGVLTTFTDLSAALDGGNNVPAGVRQGGMSIKFVCSSDNKYVQFRLMADEWSTDVVDWQGIFDTVNDNSNLATGKGIKAGTLEEKEHIVAEQNVVGYFTDKNKSIIAKLMSNGAIEWLVKNSRDILVDGKISDIENSIQGISGTLSTQTGRIDELDENAIREAIIEGSEDGIAAYITDKKKQIIGTINDKAEVEFYAGGGFAGEKTIEANIGEYIKLITSKNGVIIGGIKPNGTVHIFNAKIDNLDNDNINVIALIKSLPIIASGLDNIEISNDKRVLNLLTSVNSSKVINIAGEDIMSKLKPCITIIDDDTIDRQIQSSGGYIANQGGYFSVLLPIMLSLGKKHGKDIPAALACEGHRVGLTPLGSSSDSYSELNTNGRAVKWLHDNRGWNVLNHSMTAQLPFQTYFVDGINSELSQRIISEYTGEYFNPFNFQNLVVLDRNTGKWYELNNQSQNAWVERTPTKKYAMPLYQDYDTKDWYFNRDFDFEYSWGEWIKRADELGLPHEDMIVHNGSTTNVFTIAEGRKYAKCSMRTQGTHNYPPIPASVNRIANAIGSDNVRDISYENMLKAEVDKCYTNHTWMVFMIHIYNTITANYYVDGVTYPDGDTNYPDEWIIPLKSEEILDIIGDNIHDYINIPPSRLNISTWDEWHPAPGTKLKSFYDVIDYAIIKGVEIVSPTEGWDTHGNMLNIGVDANGQTYSYSSNNLTPLLDIEQSFLTIGADGSIRYFSK